MSDASMADLTMTGIDPAAPSVADAPFVATDRASTTSPNRAEDVAVAPLVAETLSVSKRSVATGTVRVSTRTETYDDVAEIMLDRNIVDVSRVPVGQVVDVAPGVHTEGDTIIVPVIEERLVVVKQLYLKEELHIRRRVESALSRTPVTLRRQVGIVEHLDIDGQIVTDDSATKP